METPITHLYPLGRRVQHDPRSRGFAAPEPAAGVAHLVSIRHQRHVPVFDQGHVGSCTANAAAGCLGTGAFYDTVGSKVLTQDAKTDEQFALACYSDEQVALGYGPYPPNDNGGSGLAIAKVLKKRGLIHGYRHAFSRHSALLALSKQPVIIGINWYDAMFKPTADGQVIPGGQVAGGHEIVLDQLDVENQRVWLTNSWGTSWGAAGRAWLSWADFGRLLAEQGDCTVFALPAGTP